ncbi:MAG: hypothetical protein HY565_05215 [Candidatus Kerfeldbacteria bacterium]|nr:hypothetical protein [Candidatus Kerfeldbacteria bacterium]
MVDASSLERRHEYLLTDEDRATISAFEFRLSNNLWVLRDAVDWVQDFPNAKVLQGNLANFESYFNTRRQAMIDTVPRLAASENKDLQAIAPVLQQVAQQLEAMTTAVHLYLAQPSAEAAVTLKTNCTAICTAIRPLSEQIGNNPAYRAYKHYIDVNQLEASRVTVEFDLQYDEAA